MLLLLRMHMVGPWLLYQVQLLIRTQRDSQRDLTPPLHTHRLCMRMQAPRAHRPEHFS